MALTSIFDMTDAQIQAMVNTGMNIPMPTPEMGLLRDDLIEVVLRLREIKQLAVRHATMGTGVPADQLIELLDGKKETRR